jgi:hypothetical protein
MLSLAVPAVYMMWCYPIYIKNAIQVLHSDHLHFEFAHDTSTPLPRYTESLIEDPNNTSFHPLLLSLQENNKPMSCRRGGAYCFRQQLHLLHGEGKGSFPAGGKQSNGLELKEQTIKPTHAPLCYRSTILPCPLLYAMTFVPGDLHASGKRPHASLQI